MKVAGGDMGALASIRASGTGADADALADDVPLAPEGTAPLAALQEALAEQASSAAAEPSAAAAANEDAVTVPNPADSALADVQLRLDRVLAAGRGEGRTTDLYQTERGKLNASAIGALVLGATPDALKAVFSARGPSADKLFRELEPHIAAMTASLSATAKSEGKAKAGQQGSEQDPRKAEATRGQGHGGGGGSLGLGSVLSGAAKLLAAPFTVPLAAGGRVWGAIKQMGPKPIAMQNDAAAILRREFDESRDRAIDKISHLKSGPMNGVLSEMVRNPLNPEQQWERMELDVGGEYKERGDRLREALRDPETQRSAAEVREALAQLRRRGELLATHASAKGVDISDEIEAALEPVRESMKHEGVDVPVLSDEGKFGKLSERLDEMLERLKEFISSLFKRLTPGAA